MPTLESSPRENMNAPVSHASGEENASIVQEPVKVQANINAPMDTQISNVEDETPEKASNAKAIGCWILIILGAFFCAFLLRTFVITPYEIPSGSMIDTIMIEDRVMSEHVSYWFRDPQPGEIITFADPASPKRTLIKRVIAVGGQTVDMVDGKVIIDGKALDEPYTDGKPSKYLPTTLPEANISYPYTVPEGYYWVMGDNRTDSADSRYFGAIPKSSISGHAICKYWPIDHIGVLE